ncbi:MAG: ABC transporter permease [Dongiaceae bacterium]
MPARQTRTTALLLLPAGLVFGALFVAPSIFYFVVSFWSVKLYKMRPDFTAANYLKAIDQNWKVLLFTLELAFVIGLAATILGFVFAYIVRFKAGRWGPLLLFTAVITLFGGYLMKIYAWKTILGREGVLNSALMGLGVIEEPLSALFYNPGAVIVTLIHFLLPFAILPIYSSLRGVSDIELESARDLGAGGWRTLADIVVPRCHTGLLAGFAFCFLLAVGDYVTPALVGGTISMIGSVIASQFGQALNPPLGSATSFLMLAAAFLIVMAMNLALRAWRPR